MTRLSDVARAAGVHPGTASRALNPDTRHRVSAETVKRVLVAAESLGYQPNSVARALRTRRSRMVAILIPDLTNPLFPPIVRGVEEALAVKGYSALLVSTDNDEDKEARLFAELRGRQCDGFVVATARRKHPLLARAAADGVPMVLVNRVLDSRHTPSVTADEAAGVHAVVRHLTGLGHRRIAHLAGPQELSTGLIRRRTFLDSCEQAGLDPRNTPVIDATGFSEAAGTAAMDKLLATYRGPERPTAVFAANDLLALGALDALAAFGLRCPEDMSVAGFNDMPFLTRMTPPLTTVHVPQQEIGAEAARMLLKCIDQPGPPRSLLLGCALVERASTGPVPQG
ncbi:LacI family DNA-binding transcriptional regulator [Streptomyces chiangmaiensis]|uniref:LacI family DNA-binding transcriptional regulator n=1 Tax=Streptomyces chiangmaiensis TaxID=766497 RepID=A0ABU7FQY3_9ACTN|nr:LacI family DNA-binding transcriptional regulator [Streptomyces chiangmaiensis]MED7826393.1 LacI family DNA-binding transcriptional regulator [Streptomyces chiangmaiensis]